MYGFLIRYKPLKLSAPGPCPAGPDKNPIRYETADGQITITRTGNRGFLKYVDIKPAQNAREFSSVVGE